ncbi:MAG: shikimate dehydrogenase [Elusimicrobiota bacterium]|jgi:shikimate dehydrogenase|nr:shikimate dehydrogenase [Elusimicrobiota bacterium]
MLELDPQTKYLAVLGSPIKQTLSPLIQNHWFKQNKMNCAYLALEVASKDLKVAVEALRAFNFVGFNLTVPLKTEVLPYLNFIDKAAKTIGGVNTVAVRDGKLYGYNTDYLGLDADLKSKNILAKGKNVFIYGAGGAARSVIYVCRKQGAKNIFIANRTYKKAANLANKFHIQAIDRNETERYLESSDIIFNASSCGLNTADFLPFDINQIKKTAFIYDLICLPRTPFVRLAKKRHLKFDTGEGMLVYQGAEAFKIWFGILPDIKGAKKLIKVKQGPSLAGVV